MKIRNLMFTALMMGAFASAPALAGPMIDWDPAYVYGPGAAVVPPSGRAISAPTASSTKIV